MTTKRVTGTGTFDSFVCSESAVPVPVIPQCPFLAHPFQHGSGMAVVVIKFFHYSLILFR